MADFNDTPLQVQNAEIDRIKPYPGNAKIYNDAQPEALMGPISQFGFIAPIITDENFVILAGHRRREAAKRLGMKTVPIIVKVGLSEKRRKMYRIADNAICAKTGNSAESLKFEPEAIGGKDLDLTLSGLSDMELGCDPPPRGEKERSIR